MVRCPHSMASFRIFQAFQAFGDTIATGSKRVFYLLFFHSAKSFSLVAATTDDGIWRESYSRHLAAQRRWRTLSVGFLVVLLVASVLTNGILAMI